MCKQTKKSKIVVEKGEQEISKYRYQGRAVQWVSYYLLCCPG